ncbi:MAG: ABC transporter ATP-binding protein/permease [Clostridia bacterium]|nr:ABC transporter ATP-binding protein/permease [Clostridia bacterium]
MIKLFKIIIKIQKSDFAVSRMGILSIVFMNMAISLLSLLKIERMKRVIDFAAEGKPLKEIIGFAALLSATYIALFAAEAALCRYIEYCKRREYKKLDLFLMDKNTELLSWKNAKTSSQQRSIVIIKEADEFINSVYEGMPKFIAWIVSLPIFLIYILRTNAAAVLIIAPIELGVYLSLCHIQKKLPELDSDRRKKYAKWFTYIKTTFENIDIMKAGVNPKRYEDMYDKKAYAWNNSSLEGLNLLLTLDQFQNAGGIIIDLATVFMGIVRLIGKKMNVGGVYARIASVQTVKKQLAEIPVIIESIYSIDAHWRQIELFLSENTFVENEKGESSGAIECIRFDSVGFSYNNAPLIDNFNCEFCKGKIYGLVGSFGTGKTTLLLLAAKLLSPTKGAIYLNDTPYGSMARNSLWERLSYSSEAVFIKGNMRENIAFGGEIDEKLFSEFESTDPILSRKIQFEDGSEFSAGERQRLLLYRAVCTKNDFILLDEPFSAFDKGFEEDAAALLRQAADRGKCVIFTTHRHDILDICDKVVKF